MTKQNWQVKTHEEKPNWGEGDYDEYYEIVNERGDALQSYSYDGLEQIADVLNAFEGKIRLTTALEINLHCDNQLLKTENERLKADNEKMWQALEEVRQHCKAAGVPNFKEDWVLIEIDKIATEALKTNTP